jgi:hypothetical protein
MTDSAESAPAPTPEVAQVEATPQTSSEPEMPESFGIFSEDPQQEMPSVEASPEQTDQTEPTQEKRKEFLEKIKRDRQKRAHEIELKKQQIESRKQAEQLKRLQSQQEMLRSDPNKFLREQGIDPLTFQKNLAQSALGAAIQENDSSKIEKTQMELAKLKAELAKRDEQAQLKSQKEKQQVAISKFVSTIDGFRESNKESYPLVVESLSAQEIAKGMGEHYRDTGEQLSVEEAFSKLETALKKNEESFYNDPKIIEKFQRYHPSIASQQVKGPQATLSSKWNEQPTRTASEDLTFEQIKDMYKNKLFT